MKRLLTLIAALGLGACGTDVAMANELSNGNLDVTSVSSQVLATPTGWIVAASRSVSGVYNDGASSETFADVCCSGKGLFLKPFQGSLATSNYLTVHFYQDNPGTPGAKYTLSGYAAAEANYCGRVPTNNPPPQSLFVVQFLNGGGTVLASNAYDLFAAGLTNAVGTGGAAVQFTTPQFTAPVGTVTVRAGASMINAYSTLTNSQAFILDVFDLESEVPPGAPVITNPPIAATVALGATTNFTVGVSNTAGVSYQWQLNQTNISNGGHISGATSQTLTITGVSASDVGHYRVRVSNGGGTVFSTEAALAIANIGFDPVISINGQIGDTYRVDYSPALTPTTWTPLSTNQLTTSPQLVIDATSPVPSTRFYRAVFLH